MNLGFPEASCAFGILCAVASAASTVVGMLLQKVGMTHESRALFSFGVCFFTVVKPATQILALYFAAVSVIAPIASISILLNAAIVPWWTGTERLGPRTFWASGLLVTGCVATTMFGPNATQHWSFPQLIELGRKTAPLTVGLVVLMLTLSMLLRARPGRLGIIMVTLLPSTASALNNVFLKVLLEGLQNVCQLWQEGGLEELAVSAPCMSLLALVMCIACTAFLQVWSTTVGLQIFDMLLFVPAQVALQILVTTGYGLAFFEEVPLDPGMFSISTFAVVVGVLALQSESASKDERVTDYVSIEDGPVAHVGSTKGGGSVSSTAGMLPTYVGA
eukprot:TRINITY_DN111435_c0_g1_i1.p1 TRINITY_DN111435_c0_g1~~TRINITY_DN111435_c0_g1_i1.p1  ORF type:complete len:333 (-),score=40.75 TRINITY_DN111435_c0_g1_i1:323-1321(-)